MATVKEVIEKAYTKVNGEYEAISETSDDFGTYLNVLNQVMEQWATTPYIKWQSLFNYSYTLPDIVASNKFSYTIPDTDRIVLANSPLDTVNFLNGSVLVKKYKMTDQALFEASNFSDMAALFGNTLYLKTVSPDIVGLSIQLPVYMMPPTYTSATQTVKIDSVTWLVTAMAAYICDSSPVPFIARNADKFAKEADKYMKTMRANNKHRQHLTIKRAGQSLDDQRYSSLSQAINAGVGTGGGNLNSVDGGTF